MIEIEIPMAVLHMVTWCGISFILGMLVGYYYIKK